MKHRMEEAARDSAASAEARGRPTMAVPITMGTNHSLDVCCSAARRGREKEMKSYVGLLES